jgi:hypothetical protein
MKIFVLIYNIYNMRTYLIVIFLILLIWNCTLSYSGTETLVVSVVDGKTYSVKKRFKDHEEASNILARLNAINEKLIDHMERKYANTSKEDEVEFLSGNYNGDVLSEHTPKTTVNTSYVLNKGDLIKLCLRDPETGEFHDFQTLVFVNLHELAHLLDRNYGHEESFWAGFQVLLKEAEEIGVYKPIDYRLYPVKYCGLIINSSPYYR